MIRVLTCGVVVTDGRQVLIGHATGSPRWDIPKGQADPGEAPVDAALRELQEETGLQATGRDLMALGEHRYLPRKDLALFAWLVACMPDPGDLVCSSTFLRHGKPVPEFDRFAVLAWREALPRLGKSMAAILDPIARTHAWGHRSAQS